MVLFANGDFAASVTLAVIGVIGGAIAAFIPVWWKYRQERVRHEADASAANERELQLVDELAQLQQSMAQLLEPLPNGEGEMDQQVVAAVRQLADTMRQLKQEVAELKQRVIALESGGGGDPPTPPVVDDFQALLRKLSSAMQKRGILPGSRELFVWANGFERIPVIILGRGTSNHRVLFPEKRKGKKGDLVEDDTVPVSQLEPLPRG